MTAANPNDYDHDSYLAMLHAPAVEWFAYCGNCGDCGSPPAMCDCRGDCECWELHAHLTLGPWPEVPGQVDALELLEDVAS